jgi:mannose-1-phosphate guanylyltransferase
VKAFLLAAGEGRRLRPLTNALPKCLVPINGNPLLGIWLELCRKYGITEVLINLHHLPQQVREFLRNHDFSVQVRTFYEENLLGSAGTVAANQSFIAGERDFFILYADNLTDVDLGKMLVFHRSHGSELTMGLFQTRRPQQCGIVELDADDRVIAFVEKPARPKSNLANAGIYIANSTLYRHFPSQTCLDFGFDILPRLLGNMYGYLIQDYLLDIGTVDTYLAAQKEWGQRHHARGLSGSRRGH